MINKIKKELLNVKDRKYADFSSSLIKNADNVIGVRLPILRKMAKDLIKDADEFFKLNDDEFMELTMLEGMIIGYCKKNEDEKYELIKNYIPKITNWALCDSFCSTLKFINKNKNKMKDFLKPYFKSKKEFEVRFCFVILLMYFIDDDYDYVMDKIYSFNLDDYYAKMAASWALSICLVKNFNECLKDIKQNKIHPFVFKKGITKAIESYRLNDEQKNLLKKLRKSY